ncbi:hypothetical protein [Streptomyces sp. NPDC060198]
MTTVLFITGAAGTAYGCGAALVVAVLDDHHPVARIIQLAQLIGGARRG